MLCFEDGRIGRRGHPGPAGEVAHRIKERERTFQGREG